MELVYVCNRGVLKMTFLMLLFTLVSGAAASALEKRQIITSATLPVTASTIPVSTSTATTVPVTSASVSSVASSFVRSVSSSTSSPSASIVPADAQTQSSTTSTIIIASVVGGILLLSLIGIVIFRKVKLSPSSSFKERIKSYHGYQPEHHQEPSVVDRLQHPPSPARTNPMQQQIPAVPAVPQVPTVYVDQNGNIVDPALGAAVYYDQMMYGGYSQQPYYYGGQMSPNLPPPPQK